MDAIAPFQSFGIPGKAHTPDNLITLCRSCHRAVEGLRHDELAAVLSIRRDEESRKYSQGFEDEKFLTAIRELGGSAGTSEIAENVGCDRRTAYVRLKDLEEDERVGSRKIGNSLLWSVSE
ncbi:HNH endonuclease [Haloprofundus marisrubri]|uniref:HNH endonuclease n=1 Tax=Haloprofundus marisrubri TaxID=1514971 RepID=UPI001969F008